MILVGNVNGLGWVRCEGKCSFMNSPKLKAWSEEQLKAGVKHLVIDLEVCTGMDSTFMGTMAGMAMRLAKTEGGVLEITSANDKNRQSLEDLGLSTLMSINPETTLWPDNAENIRTTLVEYGQVSSNDRTQHVYDAHKTLVDADDNNTAKFSTVLDCLEAELKSRDKSE